MTTTSAPPSARRVWLAALRPPTLVAAVVPVVVGAALAYRDYRFRLGPAAAALLGALAIQVGTNFANDLYDFRKGADSPARIGPPRVLPLGWLAPETVRRAMIAAFAVAVLAGVYLVAAAGWPVVAIGLASIAAGVGYTKGRYALAYHGLGDAAVFLFFGLVAVAGTYFVQARLVTPLAFLVAVPVGCLCTAILVVNNVRDLETDRAAGKRTLAVRLGRSGTRLEYGALLAIAFAVPLALWVRGSLSFVSLLPFATASLAWRTLGTVLSTDDGPALNGALVDTARLHGLFGLLFAAGIAVSGPGR
ncbi:MAG TPA: 1,4-dihydroxy-2-naphthoate polyprenyltransferase [Candidatus Eisenbacteria bacterium]|nr:1,4-dihydroxy-2-naphthoate polyprenyltransferase [Candidatus Eisenbacteria bacterium]